jgi:methylglutaconyl-CoA hydratase
MGLLDIDISGRGVARLMLNRPDRGNALSPELIEELAQMLHQVSANDHVRVIILAGAGRHFCAGADVAKLRGAQSPEAPVVPRVTLSDLLDILDTLPKPVIARVHGACIGAGIALANCCDVVVAMEGSFFSIPELRLGLVPTGLLPYFVRAMGRSAFRRYGLSGERIAAAEAHRLGFVHQLASVDHAEEQEEQIVDALMHAAPGAVRQFKQRLGPYNQISASTGHETDEDPVRKAEILEGTSSFRKKQPPAWYVPPV